MDELRLQKVDRAEKFVSLPRDGRAVSPVKSLLVSAPLSLPNKKLQQFDLLTLRLLTPSQQNSY